MNKICQHCKKEFSPKKGHLWGIMCSSACLQQYRENKKNPWVEKECNNNGCSNLFKVRSSNKLKKYCSEKDCTNVAQRTSDAKYKNKKVTLKKVEKTNDLITPPTQIIEYNDSPTGKAFVGIAKQPLMKNDNGIGFKGIKIQTENRELIQCYECGMWVSHINSRHLKRCSTLNTVKEYKEKYGLNLGTALVSDSLSNFYAAKIQHSEMMVNNYKNSHKAREKIKNRGKNNKLTSEKMNLHGTCPDQLKFRMVDYINRYKRIPSDTATARDGFPVGTYKKRFGSMNEALTKYGLPTRKRIGYMTEFRFPDGSVYFVGKHGMGYEELYRIMYQKCDVLKLFIPSNN